jgi:Fur family transcriptional regulator, ferric uptake regulator
VRPDRIAAAPPTLNATRQRPTRQRAAISAALDDVDGFRSAQEMHDLLKTRGERIGLATVYRALQSFAEAGEVDALRTADGEVVYRRCSTEHHHHLVCRDCGRTVEVAGPAVERWADKVSADHGFTDVSHTVEIFGRCSECSKAGRSPRSRRAT